MKKQTDKPVFFETLKVGLQKALPELVVEISDILEKRPQHLTKKDKRELENGLDQYVDECGPLIMDLEKLESDPSKLAEAYEKIETLQRTVLRGTNIVIRP